MSGTFNHSGPAAEPLPTPPSPATGTKEEGEGKGKEEEEDEDEDEDEENLLKVNDPTVRKTHEARWKWYAVVRAEEDRRREEKALLALNESDNDESAPWVGKPRNSAEIEAEQAKFILRHVHEKDRLARAKAKQRWGWRQAVEAEADRRRAREETRKQKLEEKQAETDQKLMSSIALVATAGSMATQQAVGLFSYIGTTEDDAAEKFGTRGIAYIVLCSVGLAMLLAEVVLLLLYFHCVRNRMATIVGHTAHAIVIIFVGLLFAAADGLLGNKAGS